MELIWLGWLPRAMRKSLLIVIRLGNADELAGQDDFPGLSKDDGVRLKNRSRQAREWPGFRDRRPRAIAQMQFGTRVGRIQRDA